MLGRVKVPHTLTSHPKTELLIDRWTGPSFQQWLVNLILLTVMRSLGGQKNYYPRTENFFGLGFLESKAAIRLNNKGLQQNVRIEYWLMIFLIVETDGRHYAVGCDVARRTPIKTQERRLRYEISVQQVLLQNWPLEAETMEGYRETYQVYYTQELPHT